LDALTQAFKMVERCGENLGIAATQETGQNSDLIRQRIEGKLNSCLLDIGRRHGETWKLFALSTMAGVFIEFLKDTPDVVEALEESLTRDPVSAAVRAGFNTR